MEMSKYFSSNFKKNLGRVGKFKKEKLSTYQTEQEAQSSEFLNCIGNFKSKKWKFQALNRKTVLFPI